MWVQCLTTVCLILRTVSTMSYNSLSDSENREYSILQQSVWYWEPWVRLTIVCLILRTVSTMSYNSLLDMENREYNVLEQSYWYSVSPIYRGHVYRGIGYIAVTCWTPFFWRPRARYFSRNRGNTLDRIHGRQFFAKSAHRDNLCSRFAGDNFSRNQLWPTCQCGLEHMLCDGQPSSAEHWHLHCIAE